MGGTDSVVSFELITGTYVRNINYMDIAKMRSEPTSKLKLVGLVSAVALVGLLGWYFNVQQMLRDLLQWISSLGPWGSAVFVLIYILATVLFLPGMILTMGAGFLFGVLKGSILVSIASTLGAALAFVIGRYVARDWVAKKISGRENFRAIDDAVRREGWKITWAGTYGSRKRERDRSSDARPLRWIHCYTLQL